ncbi:MAG: MBL fold metallo-hydrolase [Deltaproteobacteria bacterium]|nr:MBL fold metallo-hydrolase [Deltaproteobacteria bacterium]
MTEPTYPERLDDALRRVPLPTPTLWPATRTNTYLLGDRQLCVVDPAPSDAEHQRTLRDHLRALARDGVETVALVLTHHHADHVGATAWLATELRLPVLAHPETAARLPGLVDRLLQDGDALPCDGPAWTARHTPGHAAGHHVLVRAADGAVVAGDMVAGIGTILVDPDEGSMRLYLQSLELLHSLAPSVLYPAHGFELRPAVAALERYLEHRHARAAAVLQRVAAGDRIPEEMVPHIYQDTPAHMYAAAALSVLAMLRMHQEEGRVSHDGAHWFLRADPA